MKPKKLIQVILVAGCWLLVTGSIFAFAQKLSVDGDIETPSLSLTPKASAPVPAGPEGQIYYDSTSKDVYISDAANWSPVAVPINVATIIVAANDSLDKSKVEGAYQCTGSNDQAKINLAINDLPASGGAVYLLEGTYTVNGSININKSNVSLIGAGAGTRLVKEDPGTDNDFSFISSIGAVDARLSGILISQLAIDGLQSHSSGIYFGYVNYSKIDKIWMNGMYSGRAGIYLRTANYNIITNVKMENFDFSANNMDGLELAGSSYNIVSHNEINECTEGNLWVSPSAQYNIISGNIFLGSDTTQKYACIWAAGPNNITSNNIVSGSKSAGIWADSSYSIVAGNSVSGSASEGIGLWGDKDDNPNPPLSDPPWGRLPYYSIIAGNIIVNNAHQGIKFNAGVGQLVSANMLYENGASGAFDGIFVDGTATSPRALAVQSGSGDDNDYNLIAGNHIYDSSGSGYGIKIYSNSDSNYLTANYVAGAAFATNKIDDSGTNTKYAGKDKITFEPITVDITASGQTVYPAGKTSGSPIYPPASYIILNNTSGSDQTITLGNGTSSGAGDLLILRCKDSTLWDPITVQNGGNVDIGANRVLNNDDVLELIWNGTQWLGISKTPT